MGSIFSRRFHYWMSIYLGCCKVNLASDFKYVIMCCQINYPSIWVTVGVVAVVLCKCF